MKKLLIFPILFILSCSTEPEAISFESKLLGSWFVVQDFEFSPNQQIDNNKVYVYLDFLTTGFVDFRIFECDDNESDCTIISNEGDLNDEDKSWGLWDKSGEYQYVCFYDEQEMDGTEAIAELVALGEAPCLSYALFSDNELILHAPFMGFLGDIGDLDNYFLTLRKCTENDADSHCYVGCTSEIADNFDPLAQFDDGNCDWNTNIQGSINDINNNPISGSAILLTYELELEIPPQPYQPSVPINFSLNQDSHISIWIKDICGDTVIVLLDEYRDTGDYLISWDGTNDTNGNQVVDGMYRMVTHIQATGLNMTVEQNIIVGQMDYSHLSSIGNQNYHAISDENGQFTISLDCLSFGFEYENFDEEGNQLGEVSVPWKAKLWVVSDGYEVYSTDYYDIDPYVDADIQITLP